MEILKAENLCFTQGSFEIRHISLSLCPGEAVLLMGQSGCGKSTLLNLLAGKRTPDSGAVTVQGRAVLVPQRAEEVLLAYPTPRAYLTERMAGLPQRRLGETLGYFGLQALADRPMGTLSGGQLQLVAVAGALAGGAELLLLDEPTAQLDPIAAAEFTGLLRRLCRELSITVVLAEHRIEELFPGADRVLVMDGGQIIASGSPRAVAEQLCRDGHKLVQCLPAPVRLWAEKPLGECPLTVAQGRKYLKELGFTAAPLPGAAAAKGEAILEAKRLWFRYEKESPDILRELSFRAEQGLVHCILGGNGAGKSTLLKILAGELRPYSGRVTGAGLRMPQDPRELYAGAIGETLSAEDSPVEALGLAPLLGRTTGELSCGEVQRAAAALLIQGDAQCLLLDEPTRGMDPIWRDKLAELIRRDAAKGRTYIIVSHDTEFCAKVADRCGLFFDGGIIAEDGPEDFFRGGLSYTTAAARMTGSLVTTEAVMEQIHFK